MKILMIAPYPMPNTPIKGGVETVTVSLIEGFKTLQGIELLVLSTYKEEDATIQIAPNITIKFINSTWRNQKSRLIRTIKPAMLQIVKQWQPDIVHIQGNGTSMLLYDPSIQDKIVITQHGILRQEIKHLKHIRNKLNMLIALLIENRRKKSFRNWIFISDYNMGVNDKLVNSGINYAKIYNPVNPIYFAQPNELKTNDNQLRLFFTGRLRPLKGILDLLAAMANCQDKNIKLDLIGGFESAAYQQEIMNYINTMKLTDKITIHGWKTSTEIIDIAKESTALVLPSYQEVLPCAIAEAMAMGKIVIATTVGGIAEMVVENETGFLYTPGDIDQLTKIIQDLYSLPENRKLQMSLNALDRARKLYDPQSVAAQHCQFYSTIVQARS